MKVEQFTNDKGRPVANHFVITDDNGTRYLKSFDTPTSKDVGFTGNAQPNGSR